MPDIVKLIDLIPSQIRWKTYLKTWSENEKENEKQGRLNRKDTSQGPTLGLLSATVHLGPWTDRRTGLAS